MNNSGGNLLVVLAVGMGDTGGVLKYSELIASTLRDRVKFYIASAPSDIQNRELNSIYLDFQISFAPFGFFYSIRKFKRILETENIKIVHAHTLKAGFFCFIAKKIIKNMQFIYTGHGIRYQQLIHSWKKIGALVCELLCWSSATYVVHIRFSDYKDKIAKIFFKDKHLLVNTEYEVKITGSDCAIPCQNNKKTVLGIGKLYSLKGVDLFVDVALRITIENPNIQFLWLGDGDLPSELRTKIKGCESNIRFVGAVSNAEVLKYLGDATILLVTSTIETMPLMILESWATKCPVVSSNYPGYENLLLNNINSIVYDLNSEIDCIARTVKSILNNEKLRANIGLNGYKYYIENHSDQSRMANKYYKLYLNMS